MRNLDVQLAILDKTNGNACVNLDVQLAILERTNGNA